MQTNQNTSWQKVSSWYNRTLQDPNDFHHTLVIPKSLELLQLNSQSKLLDLACGQGILASKIPKIDSYLGVDISPKLIEIAKRQFKAKPYQFITADASKSLTLKNAPYTHITCILALQNIKDQQALINNAAKNLSSSGKFLIVLNHPCFRIPRQSSWGIDPENKLQYRRLNLYLTHIDVPITAHPGQQKSPITWSYHRPLSTYSTYLNQAGLLIEKIEEWSSPKNSVGKNAKMENRSRIEFPLFLAILATKP